MPGSQVKTSRSRGFQKLFWVGSQVSQKRELRPGFEDKRSWYLLARGRKDEPKDEPKVVSTD